MASLTLSFFSGSFHLIHLMFDEYVFLVMETQQQQTKEQNLQKNIKRIMKNAGNMS